MILGSLADLCRERKHHAQGMGGEQAMCYDRGWVHAFRRDVLGIWLAVDDHTLPSPHPQDRAGSVQKSAMQQWLRSDDGAQWIRDRKTLFPGAAEYVVAAARQSKSTRASTG